MNTLGVSIIYVAFFGCIAVACYATQSAWPLAALVFTPSVKTGGVK